MLACLLCGLSLVSTACRGEDSPAPPSPDTPIAPTDVFSRRAPAAPAAPAPKPQATRLLVVGDSLSISLGEQLERALAGTPGLDFARDGTRSTGLTRPELLDWPARLHERVAGEVPDILVVMLGANDVMPVDGPDGARVYFDNPAWPEAYAAKAKGLVDIARRANPHVRVYWVGVPSMGEASLAGGVRQVNAALAAMCAAAGCRFIDTAAAFSDPDGRFSRHGRDAATGETVLLRTADGVHLTESGARFLAGLVLAGLGDGTPLPQSAGADELRAYARDVRPVADPAAQPTPAQPAPKVKLSGKTYAVKKGDTVNGIARKLGVPAADLAAANPGVDSTRLSLGQSLRVPAKRREGRP
ncbi:MAG: GDSL-type esterase/lipase family protein [Solidesulfovibrio sp. DCME]|uniref:DUF459 domain-containing protein n=1 Tax=Solidesulfovibrio sp. DCME TaxID=3447380 RepID=UPI003D1450BF